MNFVVIGTDHRFQHSELGLEGLVRGLLQMQFTPVTAIAEEYSEAIGSVSTGKRIATECRFRWYNLDMTLKEKAARLR